MKKTRTDLHVPNDVLDEILLLLPAKSICRFKCVSRTWINLIQSPDFIKNHFHHPRNHTRLFAFCGNISDDHYTLLGNESLSEFQIINNPVRHLNPNSNSSEYRNRRKTNIVLGPANGLYFIGIDYHYSVIWQALWNPSTSEFKKLSLPSFETPKTNEPLATDGRNLYFGFGSIEEDVKLVITQLHVDFTNRCSIFYTVALYSLADDCWKNVTDVSCISKFIRFQHSKGIYFNGACYWLGKSTKDVADSLVLFDLTKEVFREINLPGFGTTRKTKRRICVRDNCSIVLFVNRFNADLRGVLETVDIWEMKEEGEWLKLLSFDHSSTYVSLNPVAHLFWTKDEIIIQTSKFDVVLYDIITHETRDLNIYATGSTQISFLSYKESLVLVKGGTALCTGIHTARAQIQSIMKILPGERFDKFLW